jgi:hypothetical protein
MFWQSPPQANMSVLLEFWQSDVYIYIHTLYYIYILYICIYTHVIFIQQRGREIKSQVVPSPLEPGGWEALGLTLPHAEMQVIGAEAPMGQGHLNSDSQGLATWLSDFELQTYGGFLK